MQIKSLLLLALLLAVSGIAPAASITNGGFETHDLSGWTAAGGTANIFVCGTGGLFACNHLAGFTLSGTPHTGVNAVAFGPTPSGSLSQTITTIANQAYNLSFWVENCPDAAQCTPNSLVVSFGATTLTTQTNQTPILWTQFTFNNVVASGASTVLSFSGGNDPSFFLIDDVTIADGSLPEPGTFAGLGLGLAAIATLWAKRARRV